MMVGKWKWRKQEISLVVQFQLCFCDSRTGLYEWMTHDGRQIQSIQLLPVNISGWKTDLTLPPLLVFLSGAGNISQSVSVVTSGWVFSKGWYCAFLSAPRVVMNYLAYWHERLVFAELFLCMRRKTGMCMWLIPTAFCSGEAVGCCTQLTEEHLK